MKKIIASLCVLFCAIEAQAAFIVAGSGLSTNGNPVSAQATFVVNGSNLEVTLQNTTLGGTKLRGDTLTGLIFGADNVALGSPTILFGGSTLFADKINTGSGSLAGSWTDLIGDSNKFGVATSGLGGLFSSSGITTGSGGDDYGIVAAGTFPAPPGSGTSNSFSASAFPLIQDSLLFVFPMSGNLSGVQDVEFAFGTTGATVHAVPEPGSLIVWSSLGLMGLGFMAYRRFR